MVAARDVAFYCIYKVASPYNLYWPFRRNLTKILSFEQQCCQNPSYKLHEKEAFSPSVSIPSSAHVIERTPSLRIEIGIHQCASQSFQVQRFLRFLYGLPVSLHFSLLPRPIYRAKPNSATFQDSPANAIPGPNKRCHHIDSVLFGI